MRAFTTIISLFFLLVSFATANASLDDLTDLYESFSDIESRDTEVFDEFEDSQQSILDRRQSIPQHCAKGVHVIATGGDGAANVGKYGNILTMVTNITSQIPGSDSVSINYPKASTHGMRKTTKGSKNLNRYIQKYHKKCPNTKLVLAGYSGGAVATQNLLCGASEKPWKNTNPFPSKWAKHILAVIIYGDETYTPNQSYNRGTCSYYTHNKGTSHFPRTKPQGCAAFESAMLNFCDIGDPRCCSGNNWADHFNYFPRYDRYVGQYVKSRWDQAHK